jgi:hypothetical protein
LIGYKRESKREEQRRLQEHQASEVKEGIARGDFEQLTLEEYTQEVREKDRRIRKLELQKLSFQQTLNFQQKSNNE